jgi:GNAT superfamily N-acetyltransferase
MRFLNADDIPAACGLSDAAGWNQTPDDWRRILELEPFGCFAVVEDGQLVATTTLLSYGSDMAWVGMVRTHEKYRRRGYARQLVTAALELAGARNIRCAKLDATNEGMPLYKSLGFENEQPVERWRRLPGPIPPSEPVFTGKVEKREDRLAFAVDRSKFIAALGDPLVSDGAYALHRPGSQARYFGPCIARNTATAYRLIAATLAQHPDSQWFWDLLPSNPAAVALARDFGFQPLRRLTRMVRGEPIRGEDSMVYAIAGFEAG